MVLECSRIRVTRLMAATGGCCLLMKEGEERVRTSQWTHFSCTTRAQVAGNLQRTRDSTGRVMYFFRMSAFKFPGNDDVYFTCSVDLCASCGTKVSAIPPFSLRSC